MNNVNFVTFATLFLNSPTSELLVGGSSYTRVFF